MFYKTFNKELYDTHDQYAKDIVFSLMRQMGYKMEDDREAYGFYDFIVVKDDKEVKVEVEQKMSWKYDYFPYETLSVPYRKHTSRAELFYEVNARGTAVAMCPMRDVLSSPVIRKNTRLGTVNEPFFSVDITKLRFYYLTDGVWEEEY